MLLGSVRIADPDHVLAVVRCHFSPLPVANIDRGLSVAGSHLVR